MRYCAALLLASAVGAQVTTVEETVDRKMTRIGWFDRTGAAHQLWVEYGAPTWRSQYATLAERPGAFRLGRDAWTTLYTSVEVEIGGTEIAPGLWHLGIEHTEDDRWSLSLFAAADVLESRTPAGRAAKLQPKLRVPLTGRTLQDPAEQLAIELRADRAHPGQGTLDLRWGPHGLAAEVRATLPPLPPIVAPPFVLPDDADLRTTDSGLRYQVLEAGAGDPPGDRDTVEVHYVLWRADGEVIDSTHDRADGPMRFPVDKVIKGMSEGFKLMRPGAKYRFVIPPELGYGDKAPPTIGDNATLVFTVEMVGVQEKR